MPSPSLGVIVVTYNSREIVLDCLESLLASTGVRLDIVVIDNASTDETPQLLRDWAMGRVGYTPPPDLPFPLQPSEKPVALATDHFPQAHAAGHRILLIEAARNTGYAGGVNRGLAALAAQPHINRFWVLNPDCAVPPGSAQAFACDPGPDGGFSLMGGRVVYLETPDRIQIDGGTINRSTGVTGNLALGLPPATTPPPNPAEIDFITGASFVASRAFYQAEGPMQEDYFLYYEEVDWALRRGNLPLHYCLGGIVYHRAGTAIGSPTLDRSASSFSLYFKHRARLRFVRRFFPWSLPSALAYSLAKALQMALRGERTAAATIIGASLGRAPSAEVREKLSPEAALCAFPEHPVVSRAE